MVTKLILFHLCFISSKMDEMFDLTDICTGLQKLEGDKQRFILKDNNTWIHRADDARHWQEADPNVKRAGALRFSLFGSACSL